MSYTKLIQVKKGFTRCRCGRTPEVGDKVLGFFEGKQFFDICGCKECSDLIPMSEEDQVKISKLMKKILGSEEIEKTSDEELEALSLQIEEGFK